MSVFILILIGDFMKRMKMVLPKIVKLLCGLGIFLTFVSVISCSKKDDNKNDSKTDSTQAVQGFTPKYDKTLSGELKIGGTFKNFESLEAIFADFREIYPNVNTIYYYVDNQSDVLNKVVTGEEAPDMIFTDSYIWDYPDMYEDVQSQALVLSDKSFDIDMSLINEQLVRKNDNGDIVFYPSFLLSAGILINENILAQNGVKIPTTYSEFIDACQKLRDSGFTYPVVGHSIGHGWEALYPAIGQGYFLNKIYKNKDAINAIINKTPQAKNYLRESLEFVKSFIDLGFIDIAKSEEITNGYDSVIMNFFEGEIPFMFTNANTITGMEKRKIKSEAYQTSPFNYCFTAFPYDDNGGTLAVFDIFGFVVNSKGQNVDFAVEFLRFLSQKNTLDKFCDLKGAPRITKNVEQNSLYTPLTKYNSRIQSDFQRGLGQNEALEVRRLFIEVGNGKNIDEILNTFCGE